MPYPGAVYIKNGIIKETAAGNGLNYRADKVIDASGNFVSPGWMDCHSHNDVIYFSDRWKGHKLAQGITLEVVGNCGFSAAPFPGAGYIPGPIDYSMYQWPGMADYFNALKTISLPVHIISMVAHGNIRAAVMGVKNTRPTPREMETMESMVREGMQNGAAGLSTGLAYPPGCFSDTEEIIALAKIAARYSGIYVTHLRNEEDLLEESVDEAVEIAREADIPLHISHLKAIGKPNHHKMNNILSRLEHLVEEGMDISFDMYPYPATCTSLTVIVPDWITDGGRTALVQKLGDQQIRKKLENEMGTLCRETGKRLYNGCTWDKVMISAVGKEKNHWMTGKSIREIAFEQDKDPLDAALDLIQDDEGQTNAVYFSLDEENVWSVLTHPFSLVGSDGIISSGRPHPRTFGSFPRFLNRAVKELRRISLETAIEKMTSKTASRFRLSSKGRIKKGMDADINIFDLEKLKDTATFHNPFQQPKGIKWVIVQGSVKKIEDLDKKIYQ